jgi:hypothetical protein
MALTGGSGHFLTKKSPSKIMQCKMKHLKILAANGVLVMIPSSLLLNYKAGLAKTPGDTLTEIILTVLRLNVSLIVHGDSLVRPLGLSSARWQV